MKGIPKQRLDLNPGLYVLTTEPLAQSLEKARQDPKLYPKTEAKVAIQALPKPHLSSQSVSRREDWEDSNWKN